jgi:predicted DNA-binding protein
MGIMTISISDETEAMFRETVKAKLGEGKGKLGKAVDEAMKNWAGDMEERDLRKDALAMLKKGLYKVSKNYTFKREEAYEDRINKIIGFTRH